MARGEDRNGIAQEVRLELDEKTLAAVRGTVNYLSSALKKVCELTTAGQCARLPA
jgi:hypothetical protein